MFDRLSERFDDLFRSLRGQGRITERNIDDTLRQIRRSLLEADVNFKVAKDFIQRVKEQALGQDVLKSLTPGQQLVKIVHSALIALLGGNNSPLNLAEHPPPVVMLVVYRPAAVDQLQSLGASIDVPVFSQPAGVDPVAICRRGIGQARQTHRSIALIDTAGRLSIDEEMMDELERIQQAVEPHEILFVADSMQGQDAVETAARFNQRLAFTGCALSKLDSDARGGAALSIRSVTGRPIKFVGTGEKIEDLESFHPDRMASRILGMGDIVSLVEKAEQAMERDRAKELEEKFRRASFTFEDFLSQLQAVRRMGPLDQLMGMIPGGGKAAKNMQLDDSAFTQVEAIINSMTRQERVQPKILNGSRRKRIARGSGTSVQEVNQLVKQFHMMQKMLKQMGRAKGGRMKMRMPLVG